jgi:Tol biopolymer transport system component
MRPRSLLAAPLALFALLAGAVSAFAAGAGTTFLTGRLDLPPSAIAGGLSGYSAFEADRVGVSDDGRYVAFSSEADLLDPAANPDTDNVYRKDRLTGAVVLVSRASGAAGPVSARPSYQPTISDDGRVIAFLSQAALDPADTDGTAADVYVRDLDTGVTTLASVGEGGVQTPTSVLYYDLSGDGAHVAFATEARLDPVNDTGTTSDIYLRDLVAGRTALVSRRAGSGAAANGGSFQPAISDDGRWVAFVSGATDLVAGYVGGDTQAFVRDVGGAVAYLVSNQTGLARTAGNGSAQTVDVAGAPAALAGVIVAYDTSAINVAAGGVAASSASSVYVHRMGDGTNSSQLVSVSDAGVNADSRAHTPSISDDGTRVEFDSDATNLTTSPIYYGVYLRDLGAGRTLLASADTFYSVEGSLSGDGGFVGFYSGHGLTPDADPDLGGVYGRTYVPPAMGATEFVSRPPGSAPFLAPAIDMDTSGAGSRTISADGRYVVFHAYSTSRLPGGVPDRPSQIYRRDLLTDALELVSRANGPNGAAADGFSDLPTISADGTRVAFRSSAQLDPAHPASTAQLYVRDLVAGTTTLVSRAEGLGGAPADESVDDPVISADGRHAVFVTSAADLGVGGGTRHVYLRDLVGGHTTLVDRASGAAGAVANDDAEEPSPSADGRLVAFSSRASNLDPADPAGTLDDVYVRDTGAATTTLVSRGSGPGGAHASGSSDAAISADGSVVAFTAEDETLAPEAGGWGGLRQVVARRLATGANTLVSRVPGGAPANADADGASVSGDGSVIAFESEATNLLLGVGGNLHTAVFARASASGALSGPPSFGFADNVLGDHAFRPAISDDGQCLAFRAHGHNAITGGAGDFDTSYVYVVSGTCPQPLPPVAPIARRSARTPRPVLSRASLTHRRFRVGRRATLRAAVSVRRGTPQQASEAKRRARRRASRAPVGTTFRFTLNTRANVAIAFEKSAQGRLAGRFCRKPTRRLRRHLRCVRFASVGRISRAGLRAGTNRIAFSGRIGRKTLKPGAYRARLRATNAAGASRWVRLSFRVVR